MKSMKYVLVHSKISNCFTMNLPAFVHWNLLWHVIILFFLHGITMISRAANYYAIRLGAPQKLWRVLENGRCCLGLGVRLWVCVSWSKTVSLLFSFLFVVGSKTGGNKLHNSAVAALVVGSSLENVPCLFILSKMEDEPLKTKNAQNSTFSFWKRKRGVILHSHLHAWPVDHLEFKRLKCQIPIH